LLKILKKTNALGANDKTLSKDLKDLVEDKKIAKKPLGEKSSHGILYVPLIETSIMLYLEHLHENFLKIFRYSLKTVDKSKHEELLKMFLNILVLRYKEIIQVILLEKNGIVIYQIANSMFTEQLIEFKKIIDQKLTKTNIKNICKNISNHDSRLDDQTQLSTLLNKFQIKLPPELRYEYAMVSSDIGHIVSNELQHEPYDMVTRQKIEYIIHTENKNYVKNILQDLTNDFQKQNPHMHCIRIFDEKTLFFVALDNKVEFAKNDSTPTELTKIDDKQNKIFFHKYLSSLSNEQQKKVKNLISHYAKRKNELEQIHKSLPLNLIN
jgi:hypothetical protein